MSQLASSLSERPKGTFPSQPVINPKNSSQVHMAEEDQMNQCNVIQTLRSEKKVDNQVSLSSNSIQHNHTKASTSFSFNPSKFDEYEKDKLASQVHKPIVPFSIG